MRSLGYYAFAAIAVLVGLFARRGTNFVLTNACLGAAKICLKPNVTANLSECASTSSRNPDSSDHVTKHYPDDVVELTMELVSIPSPSGSEHAAGHYIAEWLTRRGWNVMMPAVASRDLSGRFNVIAMPSSTADVRDVHVILSSHFDTVPATNDRPRLSETRLYGRGATDAKGIVAGLLVAAETIRKRGIMSLGLLFVCGEETDHAGMQAANEYGFRNNVVVVNGEPTTGRVCVKQKGMLKIQLQASGVACHSGYPELGSSAVNALLDAVALLRATSWPRDNDTGSETTMNIGLISGGSAANVIPAEASATIMFRLVSRTANVINTVQSVISSVPNVTMKVITQNDPLSMFAPTEASRIFGTYVAKYNTDLSYFHLTERKVLFGGGDIANAHIDDEYISLGELKEMPDQYVRIVSELLAEYEE